MPLGRANCRRPLQGSPAALRRAHDGKKLLCAPDGEFVAGRVDEMEAPSAGKREDRAHDRPARLFHHLDRFFQVLRIKHGQRLWRGLGAVGLEACRPEMLQADTQCDETHETVMHFHFNRPHGSLGVVEGEM